MTTYKVGKTGVLQLHKRSSDIFGRNSGCMVEALLTRNNETHMSQLRGTCKESILILPTVLFNIVEMAFMKEDAHKC